MTRTLAPGIRLYRFGKADECMRLIDKPSLYKKGFVDYGFNTGRPSRVTSILNPSVLHGGNDEIFEALRIFDEDLLPILDEYRKSYFLEKLDKETMWLLMKYDPGDYFDEHKDEDPHYDRTVSMVAYMNEGYVGGQIEFPDFGLCLSPEAGDVLVFPSSFAYRHSVRAITSGTRYAVVNWFKFSDRKS